MIACRYCRSLYAIENGHRCPGSSLGNKDPSVKIDNHEDERFTDKCPTCGQLFYKEVFKLAKAFIDSHVADHDLTSEMTKNYSAYMEAIKKLEEVRKND